MTDRPLAQVSTWAELGADAPIRACLSYPSPMPRPLRKLGACLACRHRRLCTPSHPLPVPRFLTSYSWRRRRTPSPPSAASRPKCVACREGRGPCALPVPSSPPCCGVLLLVLLSLAVSRFPPSPSFVRSLTSSPWLLDHQLTAWPRETLTMIPSFC